MEYVFVRPRIKTGDILMVEGRGFIGTMIRVLTGQQISHVALLINRGEAGGVWVAEFVEGVGYQQLPASSWFHGRKNQIVYFGRSPDRIRANPIPILRYVEQYRSGVRSTRYSYWSLITVWFAQLFRRKVRSNKVCSTFVQGAWEETGMVFDQTADPGDFLRLSVSASAIERSGS